VTVIQTAQAIGYEPGFRDQPAVMTVDAAERVLSDWFGADVMLTSSGRAAILLYLETLGLNRYRDRIAVPRFISACVLDAVIRRGFPIDAAAGVSGDVSILYHQFGIPQSTSPSGIVIEDICHGFFATPSSGQRKWKGEVAVFSLPKFFGLDGMAGGLVILNSARSAQLRQRRAAALAATKATNQKRIEKIRFAAGAPDRLDVESFYLSRLLNPGLLDEETGGLPRSVNEIEEIGRMRRETLHRLMDAAGKSAFPSGWFDLILQSLPFALSVFGEPESLERIVARLSDIGVTSDRYQIDVARDMSNPRHQSAVLVPCHHEIRPSKLDEMVAVIRSAVPQSSTSAFA
jgi:hypothetical protein